VVDESFRSRVEQRWKEAYQRAGAGDIKSLRAVDSDLVDDEAQLFRTALEGLFNRVADGGAALVVGHSPMLEAAVYGLVGEIVEPLPKGQGVAVTQTDDGNFKVEPA
jgi:phosphohistidine phosphatase SixA